MKIALYILFPAKTIIATQATFPAYQNIVLIKAKCSFSIRI